MNTKLETALYHAGVLTFEELGLTATNQELNEEQAQAEPTAVACIKFSGFPCGKLHVTICGDVLPELAANMLGEIELPPTEIQRDALGEIVNVICGNALPLISDPKAVFCLSSPCLPSTLICHESDGEPPVVRVSIGLEGGRADLMLFLKDCPKQEAGQ